MTTSAQHLLQAIAADPESDTPRLVYADWLLETGDGLGELIVAQIHLAAHPDDPALRRRVADLMTVHAAKVIEGLPLTDPVFRRGFVEGGRIGAKDLRNAGTTLVERLPLLHELEVYCDEAATSLAKPLGSPLVGRLRALTLLYGDTFDRALAALSGNLAASGLRTLRLKGCALEAAACKPLAQSSALQALHVLEIGSTPLGPDGAAVLAKARFAPTLRELSLWKTGLGDQGATQLGAFAQLEALDLSFNGLTAAGLGSLLRRCPGVRRLNLRANKFGPGGAAALAGLTLTALDLEGTVLGDAGIAELQKLDLGQLRTLSLASNGLTEAGVAAVASLAMPRLALLDLSGNTPGRAVRALDRALPHARIEIDGLVLQPGRKPPSRGG